MQYLTWRRLTIVGLAAAILAWLITLMMDRRGATPLAIPWTVVVVCVAAGAMALWLGWQVRRYLRGDKPDLDGLRAARTAVFAQSCAYLGAMLAGAFGGYALALVDDWSHAPRQDVIISALIAAASGAVLLGAGALAERWCRSGGDDADGSGGSGRREPEPA